MTTNKADLLAIILLPHIFILSRYFAVYGGFIVVMKPHICGVMKNTHDETAVLLGRRIRSLRISKGLTQQELGHQADVNYKFVGEIERGQQNPSLNVLVKIADALEVDLPTLFQFKQEITDRKEIESRIKKILSNIDDAELKRILLLIHSLYPTQGK